MQTASTRTDLWPLGQPMCHAESAHGGALGELSIQGTGKVIVGVVATPPTCVSVCEWGGGWEVVKTSRRSELLPPEVAKGPYPDVFRLQERGGRG